MSSFLHHDAYAISAEARQSHRNRLYRTWHLLAVPIPEDADPRWRDLTYVLQRLLDKAINHESMTEAAEQRLLDDPTSSPIPVICVWEFFALLLVSDAPRTPASALTETPR